MPLVDNLLTHYHMDRLELIWKSDSVPCLMYISTGVVKHVPEVLWKGECPGPDQEHIQQTVGFDLGSVHPCHYLLQKITVLSHLTV